MKQLLRDGCLAVFDPQVRLANEGDENIILREFTPWIHINLAGFLAEIRAGGDRCEALASAQHEISEVNDTFDELLKTPFALMRPNLEEGVKKILDDNWQAVTRIAIELEKKNTITAVEAKKLYTGRPLTDERPTPDPEPEPKKGWFRRLFGL